MTTWNVFLASQSVLVEHLIFAAADQSGMSLDAGDEAVAVTGNGKTGEGPEGSLAALGRHRRGALESNDS